MELQFQKEVCRCLGHALREIRNQEQTQEIRLTEGMPDIGRILASWGQVIARGKEWRSDSISFSGGVMVWVLYAPEDGTEPRCMESWIPFQTKWDLPENTPEGTIMTECLLRFVDARSVSARKIMVRTGVAVLAQALVPRNAEVYIPGEVPEDVQLKQSTYPVRLLREAGEKAFVLDEELTLPGSCPKVKKVMYYSLQPELQEQKTLTDKVVFKGSANLHVLFLSEDGQLFTWDFELPFSQLAELENACTADAQVRFSLCTTSLELEMSEEQRFRLKAGLLGQYVADDRQLLELVEDAYSPDREVKAETAALELPALLESRQETVKVSQSLTQDTNLVVDCSFLPDQPNQRRTADGVELEMNGQFQVLCYGEDGTLRTSQARWEDTRTLSAATGSRVEAAVQPYAMAQASAGSEIELTGTMLLCTDTFASEGMQMITGLELGERREPDPGRPSLILRRAGNEDLWEMAKACGSTVEAIRLANDLQAQPQPGQVLLIPVS